MAYHEVKSLSQNQGLTVVRLVLGNFLNDQDDHFEHYDSIVSIYHLFCGRTGNMTILRLFLLNHLRRMLSVSFKIEVNNLLFSIFTD